MFHVPAVLVILAARSDRPANIEAAEGPLAAQLLLHHGRQLAECMLQVSVITCREPQLPSCSSTTATLSRSARSPSYYTAAPPPQPLTPRMHAAGYWQPDMAGGQRQGAPPAASSTLCRGSTFCPVCGRCGEVWVRPDVGAGCCHSQSPGRLLWVHGGSTYTRVPTDTPPHTPRPAGVPIVDTASSGRGSEQRCLGTLCILDTRPRALDPGLRAALGTFANLVALEASRVPVGGSS